jgi:hypothetical protein
MCLTITINGFAEPLDVDEQSAPFIDTSSIELYSGSYNDEIIYNISFPKTIKNYQALNGLLDGSGIDLSPKEVDVMVVNNTDISPIDKLRPIRNGFHLDERFHVILYNSRSWAKLAKAKKLKDIDHGVLGQVTQDFNSFLLVNALAGKSYVDGGQIWRAALELSHDQVDDNWYWDVNEIRPLVFLTPILKRGFRSIGYYLDCPFLESEAGRRVLCYLLDDKYNDYFPKTTMVTTATVDADTPGYNRYLFIKNQYIQDRKYVFLMNPNGDFDGYTYRNHGVFEISFVFKFNPRKVGGPSKFTTNLVFELCRGNEVLESSSASWQDGNTDEITLEFSGEYYASPNRLPLQIRYYTTKDDGTFIPARIQGEPIGIVNPIEITFKVEPVKAFMREGMTYNIEKLFQGGDTLWDLTIGLAQAIFGFVTVDYNTLTISIHSPYDAYYYGTKIDGYYLGINKVVDRIKEFGSVIESDQRELTRYIELGFNPGNDINVPKDEAKEGFQKSGVYGSFIDFGEKYNSNKETFIDNYFEPTILKDFPIGEYYNTATIFDLLNNRSIKSTRFPMIVGEENYKNNNVGRRILFSYGMDDITLKRDNSVIKRSFYKIPYKDKVLYKAFFASQDFREDVHDFDLALKPLNLTFTKIQDAQTPSLYTLIAKNAIKSFRNSITGTVSTYMNPDDYHSLNRRALYTYVYRDHLIQGYVIGISAYSPCARDNDVAIDIRVSNPFLADPLVIDEIPVSSFSDHGFDFYVTKDGCTYTASEYPTQSF